MNSWVSASMLTAVQSGAQELLGDGLQHAIENAVVKAAETIHNMRWFEVVETRGQLVDGKIAHWQVTVKIGFTLD